MSMFALRRYSTPRYPCCWQYRANPVWIIWEWKERHWNISLDPDAQADMEQILLAMDQNEQHAITRQRFYSKSEALCFLRSCTAG